MIASLDEMKLFLRLDGDEENSLLTSLEGSAEEIVGDAARVSLSNLTTVSETFKIAVLYTVTYLYEHREEADHHALVLTLRDFLFGERVSKF